MNRVGFLGTGHIAAPMARVLARKNFSVTVSKRNPQVAAGLVADGLGIRVASNQGVVDASDVVFLCLRPAVWADAVAGLTWRDDQQIVSVMSGVTLAEIAQACPPVTKISATIPYGFVEQGNCPLPVVGDPSAVQALFGDENPVLPQTEETALRYFFAASALVSGVLEMLETSGDWLAGQIGDADQAEVYVANMVTGVLSNMDKSRAGRLADEKWALATPNTLNLQMVEGLKRDGAFDQLPSLLNQISASMEKNA